MTLEAHIPRLTIVTSTLSLAAPSLIVRAMNSAMA